MDVSFHVDLPPVPGCFSKLLISESDSSASELSDQPWREAEKLRELKDVMLKSLALKPNHEKPVVNGDVDNRLVDTDDDDESSETKWKEGHDHDDDDGGVHSPERTLLLTSDSDRSPTRNSPAPSLRLNTALSRLKREMASLRHLDMSLFCQLLSLNEAIQDIKMSYLDRCSDYTGSEYTCSEYTGSEYAGSEYSFGEGMGSRTGSLTSLNDEADWNRDDDPDGAPQQRGTAASGQNLAASTSSFLQQIKDLTLRVETDF